MVINSGLLHIDWQVIHDFLMFYSIDNNPYLMTLKIYYINIRAKHTASCSILEKISTLAIHAINYLQILTVYFFI